MIDVVEVKQVPNTDIALGKLAKPVTDIKPIALSRATPRKGDVLRLAGWGAKTADGPPVTHLQTGQFTVDSVQDRTVGVVGKAPAADTSACPYDSGGPYFAELSGGDQLVAVESDGPDCPHASAENASRIDTSYDWISQQIGTAKKAGKKKPSSHKK